jgi:N6-L-threonylcarbamoyladenine synthase
MYILGIESSCDETSLCLLESDNLQNLAKTSKNFLKYLNSPILRSHLISSQIPIHAKYGGVIPELGAREHTQNIHYLLENLLLEFFRNPDNQILDIIEFKKHIFQNLENIMVTTQPGLLSGLRVGLEFAKSLKFWIRENYHKNIILSEINHLNGHVFSAFWEPENSYLDSEIFPHLHLLVSGGNTQIILIKSPKNFEIIGKTLDDAAGETFDKVGRMLGIKYPAGSVVSRIAGMTYNNPLSLPVGMERKTTLDMSFAGLKTAARYKIQQTTELEYQKLLTPLELEFLLNNTAKKDIYSDLKLKKLELIKDFCISLQTVITQQLMNKIYLAFEETNPKSIGLSGGVSASPYLRLTMQKFAKSKDIPTFIAKRELSGDNALMIGLAGIAKYYEF